MVFITAGLGGGTGTGAAPVVASIAEPARRRDRQRADRGRGHPAVRARRQAAHGAGARRPGQLRECVDSVIAIPNDRLLADGGAQHAGLRGLPRGRRRAAPGGAGHLRHHHHPRPDQPRLRRRARGHEGHGPGGDGHGHRPRARTARSRPRSARSRIRCSRTARSRAREGIIVNITGGPDLSLAEASEATAHITKAADPDANVIYGIVTDESMGDAVKVTVIATGFGTGRAQGRADARRPRQLRDDAADAGRGAAAAAAAGGRRLLPQDAERQGGLRRRPLRPRRAGVPAQEGQRAGSGASEALRARRPLRSCGREFRSPGRTPPGAETEGPRSLRLQGYHGFVPAASTPRGWCCRRTAAKDASLSAADRSRHFRLLAASSRDATAVCARRRCS